MRGKWVVAVLLLVGLGGAAGVHLWLARTGGGAARDKAAAERQLVEIGVALKRYRETKGKFPASLEDMLAEKDPLTTEPFLVEAMLKNPWKRTIEVTERSQDRMVLRSDGPEGGLLLTVDKNGKANIREGGQR